MDVGTDDENAALVARRVEGYGWGLFHKGSGRKAEGNEMGPWYATRKDAFAAKPKVLASIERAHACDATCLCAFCHGSRERDLAVMRQTVLDLLNAFDVYIEDDELEPLSEAMGHARRAYRSVTPPGRND